MSDDIKKYRQLLESSYYEQASETGNDIVDHMAHVLVDLVRDGLTKGEDVASMKELVHALKQDHSHHTVEQVLDKAHQISKTASPNT